MKKCYRCGETKSLLEFHRNRSKKDGYAEQCKHCRRPNKDKPTTVSCHECGIEIPVGPTRVPKFCSNACKQRFHSKSDRRVKWLDSNYDKRMLYRVKNRAKTLGVDFNLTEEDFVIPDTCPVLGIKLEYGTGKGYNPSSPSMDKIDPNKGYVKGNVRVISSRANLLKSNATTEELRLVLQDLEELEQTTLLEEISYDV